MNSTEKRYTLAILVNNHPGVLMRVVALFSRRGYNIDSLSVGETEDEEISRITIVVSGDRSIVEQIKKQVEKLYDVKRVYEMTGHSSLQRELVMVKVTTTAANRIVNEVKNINRVMFDYTTKPPATIEFE